MMNGHIKYSFIHYWLVLLIVIVWRCLEALIVPYILAGMLHGGMWNEWNSTNVILYKFYFKLCHLSSLLYIYIVLEYLSLRIIKYLDFNWCCTISSRPMAIRQWMELNPLIVNQMSSVFNQLDFLSHSPPLIHSIIMKRICGDCQLKAEIYQWNQASLQRIDR